MYNYDQLLQASLENWEDFTTGRRRKFQSGANSSLNNRNNPDGSNNPGQPETVDSNGKPIWRGSGTVVNYVPAWERKFQKSMQQKQARL